MMKFYYAIFVYTCHGMLNTILYEELCNINKCNHASNNTNVPYFPKQGPQYLNVKQLKYYLISIT